MIYRINIRTNQPRKDISIHAHPAWEYVLDNKGNPSDDYLIVFVREREFLSPKIFKRIDRAVELITSQYSCRPRMVYRELFVHDTDDTGNEGESIISIDEIEDLRTLG